MFEKTSREELNTAVATTTARARQERSRERERGERRPALLLSFKV